MQSRVVAEGGRTGELDQQPVLGWVHICFTKANAALRGRNRSPDMEQTWSAVATEATIISLRVSVPVLSVQMTETDPKRLNRGQASNDGVAPRHRLDTDRQRDRQDGRKSLGNGSHRQADYNQEEVGEG